MRTEFTKQTKREGNDRSRGFCEAVGVMYGLKPNQRCNAPLSKGRQHDHILACSNGGDNGLSNMAVICIPCHDWKTVVHDIPRAAKIVRQSDKHLGIKKQSRPIPGSKASGLKKSFSGEVTRR